MRYDYRCSSSHVTTESHPIGKHPDTIACPQCACTASRYFGEQRIQTTHVLWAGSGPQEIPYRDNGNPIGALAYS
jgi:hypothetical protein